MVSERYFLFGIEEMGVALGSILQDIISFELLESLILAIKSGKIQNNVIIDLLKNFINQNILSVLVNDPALGDHVEFQFNERIGEKIILELDFLSPILIEIGPSPDFIKISSVSQLPGVPKIKISTELIKQIFKNNFRLLKFISLPPEDSLSLNIPPQDREYIANLIVRIFLTISTTILVRNDIRKKIINNINDSIRELSGFLS
ncbi:MAG: hypothetical protein ACTSPY_09015 [Candidatus Helarchaeota archaeon]